jgi:hypothetical protein
MPANPRMSGRTAAVLLAALLGTGLAVPAAAADTPPAAPAAPASVGEETIQKAGAALHQITRIREAYSRRIETSANQDEQRGLAAQAEIDSRQAIQEQGLSKDQYDQLMQQAQADPGLKQRLLAAAQATR